MEKIYLIKNLAPWMIDELVVFAKHTQFKVLFLRKQKAFYNDKLEQLKKNGIDLVYCPFALKFDFGKLLFCLAFVCKNFRHFISKYSLVVGVKSLWWFFKFDEKYVQQPTSIHAQFATQPALVALLLSSYYHKKQIHYCFTFHAYDIFFKNKWFVKLVNSSKKSFSISEYNIGYVLNKYKGVDPSKVKLSRLGAFANAGYPKVQAKSPVFKIGFISWFVEKKGIKYLLEAMQHIAAENKNIRLIIAGDGPLQKEMEQYISLNNLTEAVQYIGKLNFDEKSRFYASIDALVLPAITLSNDMDGIPVVLMEAVAHGLPLICTDISGLPEICIHNFNGCLIPERNTSALINAINTLHANEILRKQFAANSRKLFDAYNIENNSYAKLKQLSWV